MVLWIPIPTLSRIASNLLLDAGGGLFHGRAALAPGSGDEQLRLPRWLQVGSPELPGEAAILLRCVPKKQGI